MGNWQDEITSAFDTLTESAKRRPLTPPLKPTIMDGLRAKPAPDEGPPAALQGTRLIFSKALTRPVFDAIRKSLEGGAVEFYTGTQPADPLIVPAQAKLIARLPISGFYEWQNSLWVCTPLAAEDSEPAAWLRMVGADGVGRIVGAYAYYVNAGQLQLRVWW